MIRRPPISTLFPYTPLFRSPDPVREYAVVLLTAALVTFLATPVVRMVAIRGRMMAAPRERDVHVIPTPRGGGVAMEDRKSTRLNSSHANISYAGFCLKKKKK